MPPWRYSILETEVKELERTDVKIEKSLNHVAPDADSTKYDLNTFIKSVDYFDPHIKIEEEFLDYNDIPANETCHSLTIINDELRLKKKSQKIPKTYTCDLCPFTTVKRQDITPHRLSHAEKDNKCVKCSFRGHSKFDFIRHMKSHTDGKLHKCEKCFYVGRRKSYLYKHMKTHQCKHCSFATSNYNELRDHRLLHVQEKRFLYETCSTRFEQMISLKMHIRRKHSNERPYRCDICPYNSASGGNLKRHIRTHTGEKPFSCGDCSFKCSAIVGLKRHIACHTGEKPFSCTYCPSKFRTKPKLKRHTRVHTGEKPYACELCDYKSNQKGNIKIHVNGVHKTKPDKSKNVVINEL